MAAIQKLKIEIPLLLPGIPDEQDRCVERIIQLLQGREGIDKVHITDTGTATPKLCFHYDPDIIGVDRIQVLAQQAGATLTRQFGHTLIQVTGIRHVRHARIIENNLKAIPGIMEAAVSATGTIRLEYDREQLSTQEIDRQIRQQGLQINSQDTTPATADGHVHQPGESHDHDHAQEKHSEGDGHDHDHGGPLGKNSELIFSLLCGALLGIGYGLSFVSGLPSWVSLVCYIGAYLFGGYFTLTEAISTIRKGGFEIDFLMLVAAIGAAILGEWAEGALLLFLFSLGHSLEHYAMNKAKKSIAALATLAPKTALLKKGGQVTEVPISELALDDIIVVKPNSKIPADGIVTSGNSSVNQAPITGESVPVDKSPATDPSNTGEKDPAHSVFAGSINGNGALEISVRRLAQDSTLSRLVKLVNEAQTQKSPTQRFTDRFERIFVPAVLVLVVLLCFAFVVIDEPFSASFYRAMAVLVAASPCALAISTPSAVLSGIARAAKAGVLIKGGRPLEDLGTLTALAFDKTGTLTQGRPALTNVIPYNGVTEEKLLQTVVAVEAQSDHPLAKALVRDGKTRLNGQEIPVAQDAAAVLGKGIKATVTGKTVYIGNRALFEELDNAAPPAALLEQATALESEGHTTMIVREDDTYTGLITLMDVPRQEAKATLEQLKEIGIKRMIMLTGDNQRVADAVAGHLGLTEAWGSLLPEEKVAAVKKLREQASQVAMVGDGVNDAPAMANSTVGIAMGAAGSDVALETADVALMADKLENLPFAIGLSRKAKGIILQNLWVSLGIVALLIPLTIAGVASIGPAVMIHEGSTLLVVMNALRLLAYKQR
ncbi:heavy metal translocating P-type ATPase [Chitinophaga pendula]|uniref:heavy metal translocating P-type ATPase n=1 Tax=Chitinophaga pendula TaxID=2849666 RepID=UPI001CECF00A|nr:heavy metal translocating P-type ATPase [Chitinophaga pendula]